MTLIELGEQWEKYNYLMDKEHHSIKSNLDRLTRVRREETKLRIQNDISNSMKKMESLNEIVDYIKDLMCEQGVFEENLKIRTIHKFKKKPKKKKIKTFKTIEEEIKFLEKEFKKFQQIRACSPLDQASYFDRKIERIADRLLALKK